MSTPAAPRIFRILLPVNDLEVSRRFYEALLGVPGRLVAPGRIYFDCGPVILGVLDFSSQPAAERPRVTESVYFGTVELERCFERAQELRCLSTDDLHGDPSSPLGAIRTRPWGERSFYAVDPAGNSLCFVDAATQFSGTPEQVERLRKSSSRALPR